MTTKPTHTTLEAELKVIVQDLATSISENQAQLANGELRFSDARIADDEAISDAIQQLQQLIEKKVIEGRIDELEKANEAYRTNRGVSESSYFVQYYNDHLQQLRKEADK